MRQFFFLFICLLVGTGSTQAQMLRKPVPDKAVVLTFDDAIRTQAVNVAPLLKQYGFGATFFVCEFPPDFQDKTKYMSWDQIQTLSTLGFEIGNHTRTHTHVSSMTRDQFIQELDYIENKCREYGIPKPVSFAYPGYDTDSSAIAVLAEKKYLFARAGGSRAYDPETDHPYLIPSFSTAGTDSQRVFNAIRQARNGKIVVLTIHGVPDEVHPWVNTPLSLFKKYLQYLDDNQYSVIALRDLAQYIVPERARTLIPVRLEAVK